MCACAGMCSGLQTWARDPDSGKLLQFTAIAEIPTALCELHIFMNLCEFDEVSMNEYSFEEVRGEIR